MYTVIFITTLEGISSIFKALAAEGDVVQSGVVAVSDSQHGILIIISSNVCRMDFSFLE